MKLVIAGTYEQFRYWQREHQVSDRDARFVDRIEQVQGMRGAEIVKAGEWWRNPLAGMMDYVHALVMT